MADPKLDRLKQQLLISGMAQKNNALFQVIDQLISSVQKLNNDLANINIEVPESAGPDSTFLTATNESADLPNSRRLTTSSSIDFDDTTPNIRQVFVKDSGITTIKLNDKAVTLAKMDDLANHRLIGRDTAGTGVPESITISQLLDWLTGAAQGAIIYRDSNANGWKVLGPGTSGNFLQTLGAAQNPVWATAAIGGGSLFNGSGNPQGVFAGAIGSLYQNTTNGYLYKKEGGGSTVYGWYLLRPNNGAGLEGPTPMVIIPSGFSAPSAAFRVSGYGYFMPSVADAVDAFSPTSVTTNSAVYVNGVYYKTIATAATINTVMYMNSGGVSVNTRQALDTDFDLFLSMRTGSDITNSRWWFGITANVPTNSDSFGTGSAGAILFRYSTSAGDGGWIGQTCINGGANHTESATVSTIAANTNYKLRIRFVRTGTPTVYFSVNDGTEIAQTTNIPPSGSNYFMVFGVTTLANAAKTFGFKSIGGWHGV